jgi:hypothetical protein
MQIRTDRGWIGAGMAVLVTGVLGGGVLAAAGGSKAPRKMTAEGQAAPADKPFDLGGPAPAGAAETPKEDPEVGDKVMVGDDGGSVAVLAVEDDVSAGRLFGAGEGNKYIAAEVKGCSGPNERDLTFEPSYFLLRLDDGTMRDPGAAAKKPSMDGGVVPAGKCLSGWVTFTVKKGSLATGVIYDGSSRLTWTVPLPKNAKPTTTTTMKAGSTTSTTGDEDEDEDEESDEDRDGTTATSSKSKSTSTTGRPTATTARSSTATTSKSSSSSKSSTTTGRSSSTATTSKSSSGSTTTTSKSSGPTSTTSKSSSGSTSTTSKSSSSTTTTKPSPVTTPTTADEG